MEYHLWNGKQANWVSSCRVFCSEKEAEKVEHKQQISWRGHAMQNSIWILVKQESRWLE